MRWLEIEYEIYSDDNRLFEKTDKPIIVPIGKNLLFESIENNLKDAEVGKIYKFLVKKPYGDRLDSLVMIVPLSEFLSRNINPIPNLVVEIDGKIGIVRAVSGGRVIVDFNHPLAGRDAIFYIKVNREVTDLKEKIKGLLNLLFKIGYNDIDVSINDKKIIIKIKDYKPNDNLKSILKEYIDEIKDFEISFE